MVTPGGTGSPMRHISARLAPLPPRSGFIDPLPSVLRPNKYTYFAPFAPDALFAPLALLAPLAPVAPLLLPLLVLLKVRSAAALFVVVAFRPSFVAISIAYSV